MVYSVHIKFLFLETVRGKQPMIVPFFFMATAYHIPSVFKLPLALKFFADNCFPNILIDVVAMQLFLSHTGFHITRTQQN